MKYRFNPFDLTKVWHYADYPLIEVGKLTLNRNPENYFAEVEQSAFNPANFVPGIGPSPDKMLQGRLFPTATRSATGSASTTPGSRSIARAPPPQRNYGRDGSMRFDDNGGRAPNYEPNSFDGPVQSNEPVYARLEIHGLTGSHPWVKHPEDNDFVQAGDLYRLMSEDEKQRLVANIAGPLSAVTRDDVVQRAIGNFRNADPDYGARIAKAVQALKASTRGDEVTIQVGKPAHESSEA